VCLRTRYNQVPANNHLAITDVGNFEYWKIRPILRRVTSPEQLHEIELNSPQIIGEDEELWKTTIDRDIPDWRKKSYEPKNPKNWYQVYQRYMREHAVEVAEDKARLLQSMAVIEKEKASHVSQQVSAKSLPKQPKDPQMRPNNGGVPLGRNGRIVSGALGSKKEKTPTTALGKIRKQVGSLSAMHKRVPVPTKLYTSQIKQAPKYMIEAHRKGADAPLKIHTPKVPIYLGRHTGFVSNPKPVQNNPAIIKAASFSNTKTRSNAYEAAGRNLQKENEDRLRALTDRKRVLDKYNESCGIRPTLVSSPEPEEDSVNYLFEEQPDKATPSPATKPPAKQPAPRKPQPPSRELQPALRPPQPNLIVPKSRYAPPHGRIQVIPPDARKFSPSPSPPRKHPRPTDVEYTALISPDGKKREIRKRKGGAGGEAALDKGEGEVKRVRRG
jgi:elongin-A